MNPLPTHRIAIEQRSGIYLMFYETLIISDSRRQAEGRYEQQLLRIFNDFVKAEKAALFVISDRKVNSPLITRDDTLKNIILRPA